MLEAGRERSADVTKTTFIVQSFKKTNVTKVGDLHACFGRVLSSNVTKFFAEGRIGDVALKGLGDCTLMTAITPADGVVPTRCYLVLSDLTGSYMAVRSARRSRSDN